MIDFSGVMEIYAYGVTLRRPNNAITANFERVLHLRSAGGQLRIYGLCVDGNHQNQNIPENPNDWQHCHNIYVESAGERAVSAYYKDCDMINRVGAGISHGSAGGALTFENIITEDCTGGGALNIRGCYEVTRSYSLFENTGADCHRIEVEIQNPQAAMVNKTVVDGSVVNILDVNTEQDAEVDIQNSAIATELRLTHSTGLVKNNDIKITNEFFDIRPLKVRFEGNRWFKEGSSNTFFRAAGSGVCQCEFIGENFDDDRQTTGFVFFDMVFAEGESLRVAGCDFISPQYNAARMRAGVYRFEGNSFQYDGSNIFTENLVRTQNDQSYSLVEILDNTHPNAPLWLDQSNDPSSVIISGNSP